MELKGNVKRVILEDEFGNILELDNAYVISDIDDKMLELMFNINYAETIALSTYGYLQSVTEYIPEILGESEIKDLQRKGYTIHDIALAISHTYVSEE